MNTGDGDGSPLFDIEEMVTEDQGVSENTGLEAPTVPDVDPTDIPTVVNNKDINDWAYEF
jgi:hypothetical protein